VKPGPVSGDHPHSTDIKGAEFPVFQQDVPVGRAWSLCGTSSWLRPTKTTPPSSDKASAVDPGKFRDVRACGGGLTRPDQNPAGRLRFRPPRPGARTPSPTSACSHRQRPWPTQKTFPHVLSHRPNGRPTRLGAPPPARRSSLAVRFARRRRTEGSPTASGSLSFDGTLTNTASSRTRAISDRSNNAESADPCLVLCGTQGPIAECLSRDEWERLFSRNFVI
jgi:hypothetical protein